MAYNFSKRIEFITLEGGYMPGDETEVSQRKAWADIKTLKGSEIAAYSGTALEGSSRFIIRYCEGINNKWTIKYKGEQYKIESITNDDEQNYTITIIGNAIITD